MCIRDSRHTNRSAGIVAGWVSLFPSPRHVVGGRRGRLLRDRFARAALIGFHSVTPPHETDRRFPAAIATDDAPMLLAIGRVAVVLNHPVLARIVDQADAQ